MTSHYLSGIVKSSFETVFEAVGKAFGNVHINKFGETGKSRIGLVLGEKFFLRVKSDVAVLITLKELSSDETNLEVLSCAGGKGIVSISYAAHEAYVHDVRNFLTNSGFKIDSEKEIPHFERYTTPPAGVKTFLKKCPYCDREIPIASEECPYCGTRITGV